MHEETLTQHSSIKQEKSIQQDPPSKRCAQVLQAKQREKRRQVVMFLTSVRVMIDKFERSLYLYEVTKH
jgi:hypothetical protein